MKRFNIEENCIEFKNLISGPAPVGRILNYIYLCGQKKLKHKNGKRNLNLNYGIGSAWTTELMIGLDLVYLGEENNRIYNLELTKKGKEIFDILNKKEFASFNEGITSRVLFDLKEEMDKDYPGLYCKYKDIFTNSIPFKNLKEYLNEKGYIYDNKKDFEDGFFEKTKELYDTNKTLYVKTGRTTAGQNRVPSLLQHCILFGMLDDKNGKYIFNQKAINKVKSSKQKRKLDRKEIECAAKETDKLIKALDAEKLAKKYGIDGNQLINAIVRNSKLQVMFKNNLTIEQKKCLLCKIDNQNLLIGSHIVRAADCNAYQKADYNNGLLLCCNHDKLFDRHLISFNPHDGKIKLSKTLSKDDIEKLSLNNKFKLPNKYLTNERKKYLIKHFEIFESEERKR